MSNLRIFGCVIGLVGLTITFLFYRGARWNRSNFLLIASFNLILFMVSVNPDIVNFVRDALPLQESSRGRIIALLIISNIFILFFLFYTKSKFEKLRHQFDKLIRNLGGDVPKGDGWREQLAREMMRRISGYNDLVEWFDIPFFIYCDEFCRQCRRGNPPEGCNMNCYQRW